MRSKKIALLIAKSQEREKPSCLKGANCMWKIRVRAQIPKLVMRLGGEWVDGGEKGALEIWKWLGGGTAFRI